VLNHAFCDPRYAPASTGKIAPANPASNRPASSTQSPTYPRYSTDEAGRALQRTSDCAWKSGSATAATDPSPSRSAQSQPPRCEVPEPPAPRETSTAASVLLVVHLKSVVVAGKRFCCDAEQHPPPASVRVADQPRADDDATSLSLTPMNCPLGERSFTATGRLRCSPPNVVRSFASDSLPRSR
jgi:hypothetical protein